jgi:Asp-tRNA(Asn)/Glu-tRNA(Gln) amidotransferase A subunit family amidase
VRLPAAYNGVFALKPSLGRVPIYPPFLGRVTGPMTRTVTDAALLMTALTKPDPRDFMALPYQEIDWPGLLQSGVKGKKLGLLLDIGIGLTLQPAVRAAIEAAAKAFERAGAVVEPVAPFLTAEIAAGIDGFFQARLSGPRRETHSPHPWTFRRRAGRPVVDQGIEDHRNRRDLLSRMVRRSRVLTRAYPRSMMFGPASRLGRSSRRCGCGPTSPR